MTFHITLDIPIEADNQEQAELLLKNTKETPESWIHEDIMKNLKIKST